MVVGGAAGKSVRKADLLTTVETTEQALEAVGAVLPVLPGERQLSRAHLRLRRAPRHREGAEGHGLRARRRRGTALLDRLHKSKARSRGRLARRADAEAPDAVHPARRRWTRCWHDRAPVDSRHDVRQHPAREGRRGDGWRPRDRHLQPWRPLPGHRQPLPAPRRAAVRRHRHRQLGRLPAARLEDQPRDRQVERPADAAERVSRPTRRASRTASSWLGSRANRRERLLRRPLSIQRPSASTVSSTNDSRPRFQGL